MLSRLTRPAGRAFLTLSLTVLIAVGSGQQSRAHEGATGIVKERQQGMVAFKDAMKAWKLALDDPKSLTPGAFAEISRDLSSNAGARLLALYPKDGPTKHTDASSRIWSEWAKFERLANELEARARALETMAIDETVLRSEFKAIGGICKACHESFRER
jgi:cytochrome c556